MGKSHQILFASVKSLTAVRGSIISCIQCFQCFTSLFFPDTLSPWTRHEDCTFARTDSALFWGHLWGEHEDLEYHLTFARGLYLGSGPFPLSLSKLHCRPVPGSVPCWALALALPDRECSIFDLFAVGKCLQICGTKRQPRLCVHNGALQLTTPDPLSP